MLCDHSLFRKSRPYCGSAGIPFIISAPNSCLERAAGSKNADWHKISQRMPELRDVMPTLLTMCGLDTPETVDGKNVFAPDWDREYIHGEHLYDGDSYQWIVTEKDKFIWCSNGGQRQYFDLENDPCELHNAINDKKHLERINKLEHILIKELAWREEGFVQDGKLTPNIPVKPLLNHSRREVLGY